MTYATPDCMHPTVRQEPFGAVRHHCLLVQMPALKHCEYKQIPGNDVQQAYGSSSYDGLR